MIRLSTALETTVEENWRSLKLFFTFVSVSLFLLAYSKSLSNADNEFIVDLSSDFIYLYS